MKAIKNRMTPWGKSDSAEPLGDSSIVFYSTPSHGGYLVPLKLNSKIPVQFREDNGWYEEDCAWAVVAQFFPQYFSDSAKAQARRSLRCWYWREWEEYYKESIPVEESSQKGQYLFDFEHAEDMMAVSAILISEGEHKGKVKVSACKGGRACWDKNELVEYVVTAERYRQASPYGYLIKADDIPVPHRIASVTTLVTECPACGSKMSETRITDAGDTYEVCTGCGAELS